MKKFILSALFSALLIGLPGCSSTPEPPTQSIPPLLEEFQVLSAKILESGDLAAIGTAKSKSLDIALNKAKIDGRIKLADLFEAKIEALPEEVADLIQGLVPKRLEHETTNGVVTAYALMELGPKTLNQKNKTLSTE